MRSIALTLSVISLTALATSGCSNQLDQPLPGPTPTAAAAPAPGTAGAPLVPGNTPGAGSTIPVTPAGQPGGQPLVAPGTPAANGQTTEEKQEKSGYFPSPDTPLAPPTSGVR